MVRKVTENTTSSLTQDDLKFMGSLGLHSYDAVSDANVVNDSSQSFQSSSSKTDNSTKIGILKQKSKVVSARTTSSYDDAEAKKSERRRKARLRKTTSVDPPVFPWKSMAVLTALFIIVFMLMSNTIDSSRKYADLLSSDQFQQISQADSKTAIDFKKTINWDQLEKAASITDYAPTMYVGTIAAWAVIMAGDVVFWMVRKSKWKDIWE